MQYRRRVAAAPVLKDVRGGNRFRISSHPSSIQHFELISYSNYSRGMDRPKKEKEKKRDEGLRAQVKREEMENGRPS